MNRTAAVAAETSRLVPLTDVGVDDTWAMVEASPDGMILTDQDGLILVVNSRIEAMVGHDRGDEPDESSVRPRCRHNLPLQSSKRSAN